MIPSYLACNEEGNSIDSRRLATCRSLFPDSNGIYNADKENASTDVTFLFKNPNDHLTPGLNHMFCTFPAPGIQQFGDLNRKYKHETPICQPFTVQVPFFWADAGKAPKLSRDLEYCKSDLKNFPCPFALITRGKFTVAVFGVVGPDLLSNVGMLNTGWLNNGNRGKWDTLTQVTAPDYALLQAIDSCNSIEDCRTAPKVLMAQMSYARASQLISSSA